jgi:hypothetical protein
MRRFLAAALFSLMAACTGSIDDGSAPTDLASDDAGSTPSDSGASLETGSALEEDAGETGSEDTGAEAKDTGTEAKDSAAPDTAKPAEDTAPAEDAIATAGPSSTRQTAHPLDKTDAPNGFFEYLPPGYSKTGAKVPLMIFWHGIGEDGNGTTDLDKVVANGPPKLIKADKWPNDRPWIVLSPQNPSGCPSPASIKAFIAWSLAHYNVDLKRVYLTGLSCGAIGSWNYLQSELDTTPVAAAVLIAGNGTGAWDSHHCDLGKMAIWAFHGDADGTVAPSGTTYPMNNLVACPSPPRRDAKMTIYPGVGHDSWTRTYDLSAGHDIYAWMLANHL